MISSARFSHFFILLSSSGSSARSSVLYSSTAFQPALEASAIRMCLLRASSFAIARRILRRALFDLEYLLAARRSCSTLLFSTNWSLFEMNLKILSAGTSCIHSAYRWIFRSSFCTFLAGLRKLESIDRVDVCDEDRPVDLDLRRTETSDVDISTYTHLAYKQNTRTHKTL